MKSLITILLFASLGTLFAQDCNNPLLAFFGFSGLDSPQSGADLPYCTGLQEGETCCSADTVSGFQDIVNILIDNLNNYAAGRDLYIAQLRNSYFDRFSDLVQDINDDHNDDLDTVRDTNATLADELQNDIDSFNQANTDAQDINNQFLRTLDDYQAARNNCFTTALQVQSSAWCLACNPNYANLGVNDDGSVTFSDSLCQAIDDACRPFFDQGSKFNPLIRARELYWRLLAVSRYLDDVSDNDQVPAFNVGPDPYNPLSSQQDVTVPEAWAAGNAGQCQDLWSGNEQLAQLLAIGVAASDDNNNENEVVVVEEDNVDDGQTVIVVDNLGRLLQDTAAVDDGTWAPDLAATGLNFDDVRSDPGDFWNASDYSDYFNQTQNASDRTDGDDNDDHTDHDPVDTTDQTDNQ